MESHTLSSGPKHDVPVSPNLEVAGGSSRLQKLGDYAKDKYHFLEGQARTSDDAQPVFTSAAYHYVRGSDMTARVALRAVELDQTEA